MQNKLRELSKSYKEYCANFEMEDSGAKDIKMPLSAPPKPQSIFYRRASIVGPQVHRPELNKKSRIDYCYVSKFYKLWTLANVGNK